MALVEAGLEFAAEVLRPGGAYVAKVLAGAKRPIVLIGQGALSRPDGLEVLAVDAYPQGNLLIGTEETARAVKASGVDAVIVGNAS